MLLLSTLGLVALGGCGLQSRNEERSTMTEHTIEYMKNHLYDIFRRYKALKEKNVEIRIGEPMTIGSHKSEEISDTTDSNEEVDVIGDSDDSNPDITRESSKSQRSENVSANHKVVLHVCTYEGCDKFFSRPSRLAQHIRTHTGERPFVCPSEGCSKLYTRQQHLKRHIETAHEDRLSEAEHKCEICDKRFVNLTNLKKHKFRFHIRPRHTCDQCGQSFMKHQQLQKHTYVHTQIKPFPCDYPGCDMRCLTLSVLKRHRLKHQKSRYACPHDSCQEKFDTYKDLQHHFITGHPKVCDICSRPFKQLRHLRKHRCTHENTVEAYFCPYPACDKYYTQENNLMTHVKDKHEQLSIYECGVCEKRLSSKQKLIHHMTTHSPSYKRNYSCKKPRKPRKDKGSVRRDFARLLSGYWGNEEDSSSQVMQSENTNSNDGLECSDDNNSCAKIKNPAENFDEMQDSINP